MTVVTITRHRDPLQGQRVQVLRRWRRKHGRVDLLVVLPNGGKRLIPQAWTDAEAVGDVAADWDDPAATLATVADLSAAAVIVAALVRRNHEEQAASQSTREEDNDAACPAQSAPNAVPGATRNRAGSASANRRGRSDPTAGAPDRQSGRQRRGAR
jgi:hypothetical protein